MWTFFVLASVFVLVLLYIPGYMMSRVVFASADALLPSHRLSPLLFWLRLASLFRL